ncbi:replication initiation protein [Cysteiniphilum halobium]|uniref:replication initiation protein n=1 Tax=Cysteiniphilum halobium TaxID=2219059 RepID=UPI000E657A38|nr:replication initiation protein [Cysteiniphilum halobium]
MRRNAITITKEKLEDRIVVQSNSIVEAHYSLGVPHKKIILILASLVNPNDTEFREVEIKVTELCRILDLDGKHYSHIRKITEELSGSVIKLITKNGKALRQAPWMSYAEYEDGFVRLKLNDAIKPFILQLSGHFTEYKLACAIQLKSMYSIRLYELLMQYKKIKSRKFDLSDLRKILYIPDDKLSKWHDFKKRVIDHAQAELKGKSDIIFTYEPVKTGRSVTAINFKIKTNNTFLEKMAKNSDTSYHEVVSKSDNKHYMDELSNEYGDSFSSMILDNLTSSHETELEIILKNEFSLVDKDILKLIDDHGKEKLWEKYHYYHYKKSTTEIKNPTAWFINAVIKDYSIADMKQAKTIDVDWGDFNPDETRLTDLKNELKLLNDTLKEAQDNLASPVSQYSSALREQYQKEIKITNAKIVDIQKEIKELDNAN